MAIDASALLIVESAHMPWADDDGAVTVPPGGSIALVEYDTKEATRDAAFVHAIGASDADGLEYRFTVGEEIKFATQSPLGSIPDPFSFPRNLGHALSVSKYVRYEAVNTTDTEVKAVGRMFIEES